MTNAFEQRGSHRPSVTVKVIMGLLTSLLVNAAAPGHAAGVFPDYYEHRDLAFGGEGVCRFGLYGWQNPAVLGTLDEGDLLFVLADDPDRRDHAARWGLFMAQPHHGFGVIRADVGSGDAVTDYRYSIAGGNRTFSVGAGYGWSAGPDTLAHQRVVTTGLLARPARFLSLGLTGVFATSGGERQGSAELGLRPLGDERIAVCGDIAVREKERLSDARRSVGAIVEPVHGIRLAGRYFDDERVSAGVQVSFGRSGLSTQVHSQDDRQNASWAVRVGGWDRTMLRASSRGRRIVKVDLNGTLAYQRRSLFDRSMVLRNVVETLHKAAEDEAVGSVAVSISGLRASRAMMWELRRELEQIRSAGKTVIVFAENLDEWSYDLASAGDHVVLDPLGAVFLKGFVLGRTYLKGMLDAVGIGAEEWRYFAYKSAFEAFSRDRMSDGEREQLQRMADGFYEALRADLQQGRGVAPETFDRWMDEGVLLRAPEALEQGIVDRLGRWDDVDAVVEGIVGGKRPVVSPRTLVGRAQVHDDRWGEPPTVAVVYALGACAMDEGITARKLVKDLRTVERDGSIKAVVLRVDSPGGDALASDVIAEALQRIKKNKPVIVSQGQVAASGGYWLSMYGDQILATPLTLTGSIGVIGGWFYNQGLKEKLGMTTDFVQAGRHADLGFGFRFPFLGFGIPDRSLTDDERAKVEHAIKAMYEDFVGKVARGRNMGADSVAVLAQGRVWLGMDAKERGLVDELGGLRDAVVLAKERAGIPADEPVHIAEFPRPKWFELPGLLSLVGVRAPRSEPRDIGVDYLRFRLESNGRVMPVLGMSEMEAVLEQAPTFE